ncbi:MAG: hypothetical protein H8Z69_02955 [Nanohaloarchaea archaeon]|nr:hypothetical protein [Candidatus Nanohaloarchaea archaeon]
MACSGTIIQCVSNNPTVVAVGAVAGFVLAKAMNMRKRNRGMGGMGGF